MPVPTIERPVSALRQRMIEDMAMRGLRSDTQHESLVSGSLKLDRVEVSDR
jgi:hypothetical protein